MSPRTDSPQRNQTADQPDPPLPEWVRNFRTFPRLGPPIDGPNGGRTHDEVDVDTLSPPEAGET